MPNSVQWRSEYYLVNLFCTCRSKIRLACTSLREGGIYVGSPYDLLAENVRKSFLEAKGRTQDFQLPIQEGYNSPPP